MSVTGHRWSGIAFAFLVAFVLSCHSYPDWTISIAGLAAFWGSTAPDWLEIAKGVRRRHLFGLLATDTWGRRSVIPHRTITHWFPLWLAALAYASWSLPHPADPLLHALLLGFSAGGFGHLLCDFPNPTGVPLLTPFPASRKSLHWWKSGDRREWFLVALFWLAALLCWSIVR